MTLRKFLGYCLDERTPDESTLRKTRAKMPEEAFRAVFDHVLDVCQSNGLVNGRAIGTDSTLVDANAAMDSPHHKELGCGYEEYVPALRRRTSPTRQPGRRYSGKPGAGVKTLLTIPRPLHEEQERSKCDDLVL